MVAVEVEEWSASGSVLHRTVHISDVESEIKKGVRDGQTPVFGLV